VVEGFFVGEAVGFGAGDGAIVEGCGLSVAAEDAGGFGGNEVVFVLEVHGGVLRPFVHLFLIGADLFEVLFLFAAADGVVVAGGSFRCRLAGRGRFGSGLRRFWRAV